MARGVLMERGNSGRTAKEQGDHPAMKTKFLATLAPAFLAVMGVAHAAPMNANATLTKENGAPVADNQRSQSAGPGGSVLLQDFHLIEKLARFDRERVPERVVHARGVGAYGEF